MRAVLQRIRTESSRRRFLLGVGLACGLTWLGSSKRSSADEATPEFRVVVHPSHAQPSVERALLADAFLKKITRWSNGETVRPVDLKPDAFARKRFTEVVLKRSVGAVRSYWQQRIFSGRDVPPQELDSDEAVVAFVAKYPGAVGYVSGAAKLSGVRELAVK